MTTWLVGLLLTIASPASAALMPHYDLRSLFFDAEVVVRVVTLGERTKDYVTTARYRVIEGYQGPYAKGDVIEASGLGNFRYQEIWDEVPPPPPDPERVVFLRRDDSGTRWWIAGSGMRVRQADHWKAFRQEMNPGLYVPVPQTAESGATVSADERQHGLRDVAFARELQRAKRRADAVRKAIATGAGRDLVALCGPPPGVPARAPYHTPSFFDSATGALLAKLATLRPVDALLDGIARAGSVEWRWRLQHAPLADVLLVALDSAAPRRRRIAALQLLEVRSSKLPAAATPKLLNLVRDPDAKVRASLLRMALALPSPPVKEAVVRAWSTERDPMVRVEMLQVAAQRGWRASLTTPRPVEAAATRRQKVLHLRYAFHRVGWSLTRVGVELTHETTGAVLEPELEALQSSITHSDWGSYAVGLDRLRLPSGTYRIALYPRFRDPAGASHTLRVTAEDWDVSPEDARDRAAASVLGAGLSAAPTPLEKTIPMMEPRGGCSCTSGGGSGTAGAWLAVLLLSARGWRRRPW